jgi:hypothetical protein
VPEGRQWLTDSIQNPLTSLSVANARERFVKVRLKHAASPSRSTRVGVATAPGRSRESGVECVD